jgi:hypothetical protein
MWRGMGRTSCLGLAVILVDVRAGRKAAGVLTNGTIA